MKSLLKHRKYDNRKQETREVRETGLKAYLHAAICLRFVVPICRPREIVKQIGACKWRPDARAISVRHVGRFGKIDKSARQIAACK